jgi:hypothetical protein
VARQNKPIMSEEMTDAAARLAQVLLNLTRMIDDPNVRLHSLLMAASILVAGSQGEEDDGAAIETIRRLDAAVAAVVDLMKQGVKLPLRP